MRQVNGTSCNGSSIKLMSYHFLSDMINYDHGLDQYTPCICSWNVFLSLLNITTLNFSCSFLVSEWWCSRWKISIAMGWKVYLEQLITFLPLHLNSNSNIYMYWDIYIYIYMYIYIFWQHFFINTNFIKHNRHFLSTYFLLDQFIFPYCFYCIRRELIYVLSIVVCIPSTFCLTLGHHQGRIYYKSDVTFVFAYYYYVRASLLLKIIAFAFKWLL